MKPNDPQPWTIGLFGASEQSVITMVGDISEALAAADEQESEVDFEVSRFLISRRGAPVRVGDRSVRDVPVNAKLWRGDVMVESKHCHVVFGFPAAVWPVEPLRQLQWIERLTPWWDMDAVDWSPQAQRLRESCRAAVVKLLGGAR